MDFLQKVASKVRENHQGPGHDTVATENKSTDEAGKHQGLGGGLMNSLNNMMGGGAKGEKEEGKRWRTRRNSHVILTFHHHSADALDKAVDWVQEHVLKQGPQDNESAVEQQKDEMISDSIRSSFKKATGHDIPIADK